MSVFHEVQFPVEISRGSSGGPGFNTSIVETDSGREERVARWSYPRHTYDVSRGINTIASLAEVRDFYLARMGAAIGFRYKDWADYHSNPVDPSYQSAPGEQDQDCIPAVGDGVRTTFQLAKRYISGPGTQIRAIIKPIGSTVRMWVAGVEQIGNWSVNETTGVVTFTGGPPSNLDGVQASFEFDVPVRFGAEADRVLSVAIEGWDAGSISSIPLVELIDDLPHVPGDYPYGGSYEIATSVDLTMTLGLGHLWVVNALDTGLALHLPDPTDLPTGQNLFTIINEGATNSFAVKNESGTTLVTLAPGEGANVCLSLTSGLAKIWYTL